MNEAAAGSLQNLHDVIAPAPVGMWPPAPGWYFLLGLALLGLALLAYRKVRTYRRNRYRRTALRRLDGIRQNATGAEAGPEIALLLKQTALAAWPRTGVASLTGPRWAEFLADTGASEAAAEGLSRAGYQRPSDSDGLDGLCTDAEHWIRSHRGPAS
jgi:hypothetical protein